mmetsp:Transcript_81788/g.243951  ORF Transcript_81788/g.243951 Transcript_81788/m.243951 type:complete len:277 (-) Transcript_81788:108-938(-)
MGSTPSSCMRSCWMTATPEYAEDMNTSPDQPIGHGSTGSASSRSESPGRPALVPPVTNWLQAIKRNRSPQQETPRFDEVYQSARTASTEPVGSPRSADAELQTPRDTPRPGVEDASSSRVEELAYSGDRVSGRKHGSGTLKCTTSTYTGQFQRDCKHGKGVLCWNDGRCYTGQFEEGKFHGTATMTWPDGRAFVGQYVRDRKQGEGTFSWPDGRRYEGQWIGGKRHGVGVYTNAKGLTRRGWWQHDRPMQWEPLEVAPLPAPTRLVEKPEVSLDAI